MLILSEYMVCEKCNYEKPSDEFSSAYKSRCKECVAKYRKEWKKENHEKVLAEKRRYRILHHDQIIAYSRRYYDEKIRPYTIPAVRLTPEERKERLRIIKKAWKKNNPQKHRAHKIVDKALRSGKLIKPPHCIFCLDTKIDAHHPDYSQPLYVIWVCRLHHKHIHNGKIQIPKAS